MIEYHTGLLLDDLRTRTYRDAIHRLVHPGDIVVDLGSGTGILSFFALEAGAAKVYAIERTHMADVARMLVKRASAQDRIVVLHDESTVLELPERADVLVTETIGSFGFDEQILSSVLDARARLLKPDARVLPRQLSVGAVPVELPADYDKLIARWSERVHGVDLAPLRGLASNTLHHLHVSEQARIATGADVLFADLETLNEAAVDGRASFTIARDAVVHGFAVWFTAALVKDLTLTNRGEHATHWSQGFLPLEFPVPAKRGAPVELELETVDGRVWGWRGTVGEAAFDQTTGFAMPPCSLARRTQV